MLALKGNQGSLRDDVELFVAEQKAAGFKHTEISRDQTIDGWDLTQGAARLGR